MSSKILDAIGVRVVPRLAYWLIKLWFFTCRETVHNVSYFDQLMVRKVPLILSFWHYGLAFVFYHQRNDYATVMVSASKDGEYIARLANCFGMDTVRGSSNKQGLRALKNLVKIVKDGSPAGIVADGSQGPALKVQAGAVLLASKTGSPIVPVVWSANRYISFNSWDRLSLPKPFAKVDYFYGEPLSVPDKISSEELEVYRTELENRLLDLYTQAWKIHGKERH